MKHSLHTRILALLMAIAIVLSTGVLNSAGWMLASDGQESGGEEISETDSTQPSQGSSTTETLIIGSEGADSTAGSDSTEDSTAGSDPTEDSTAASDPTETTTPPESTEAAEPQAGVKLTVVLRAVYSDGRESHTITTGDLVFAGEEVSKTFVAEIPAVEGYTFTTSMTEREDGRYETTLARPDGDATRTIDVNYWAATEPEQSEEGTVTLTVNVFFTDLGGVLEPSSAQYTVTFGPDEQTRTFTFSVPAVEGYMEIVDDEAFLGDGSGSYTAAFPRPEADDTYDVEVYYRAVESMDPEDIVDDATPIAAYVFVVDGVEIDRQWVKNGETVYAPASPEKEGCKFIGWLDAEGNAFTSGAVTVTGSVTYTYTAAFAPVYYVFFLNTEGVVCATKEGTNGAVISADATFPVDADQAITGWYTDSALTNRVDSVTLDGANVTLYPKVEKGHWITYHSDGGTYIAPAFVQPNALSVAPAEPTREGYTFQGWYNGDTAFPFGTTLTENVTLTARWQGNPDTQYTIVYWIENANDTAYTFEKAVAASGTTGETVTLTGTQLNVSQLSSSYRNYFHYDHYDENVTIQGDGSAIVNVYFARNVYNIRFTISTNSGQRIRNQDGNHVDVATAPVITIGGAAYTTTYTFSAKYEEDISAKWPTASNVTTNPKTNRGTTYYLSTIYGNNSSNTSKRITLTADLLSSTANNSTTDYTFYWSSTQVTYHLHYMLQPVDGSTDKSKYIDSPELNQIVTYYTSAQWNQKSLTGFTAQSKSQDGSTGSDGDYDVYFYYTRNQYDLTFINGNSQKTVEDIYYEADISGQNYTPEKPSGVPGAYTFSGWYTTESCTAGTEFNWTGATMPCGNLVLYAKWSAPEYVVTAYLTMDGGASQTIAITYGSKISEDDLPAVTVPDGYTWRGWAQRIDNGNGTYTYIPFNLDTEIYSDIALYPYYTSNKSFTITYDANGGTGAVPVDTKLYADGSYADVMTASTLTAPTDKVFLGWGTAATGGTIYQPGDKLPVQDADITLYAIWGDQAGSALLIYDPNGGSGTAATEVYRNNQSVLLKANTALGFTRAGYAFVGWSRTASATTAEYQPGNTITVDGRSDNVLYAIWRQMDFQVTYSYTGTVPAGAPEVPAAQTWAYGSDVSVNANPTLTGYYFTGWTTGDAEVTDGSFTMPEHDVAFTGSWEKDETQTKTLTYTVQHQVDGTVRDTQDYTETVWVNDPDTLTVQTGSLARKTYTGYKYDSMTPETQEGATVANGTVITLVYVKDETQTKTLTYTVQHQVDGTVRDTQDYTETVWVNDPDTLTVQTGSLARKTYTGYKYDSMTPETQEGATVANGTVITLVYVKDETQTKTLTYTVQHQVDGTVRDTQDYTETVWVNDPDTLTVQTGSLAQKTYTGYKYDSMTPETQEGATVANGTVITLVYVKDETQTKTLTYTVQHQVDGTVRDTQDYTETVWVNDPDTLTVQTGSLARKTYTGYKYDSMTPETEEGSTVANGTVITLVYVKDETQTKTLTYTVQHQVDGTVRDTQDYTETVWVNDPDTLTVQTGSLAQKTYTGYKYDSMTPETEEGELVADGTVITLVYVKDETQTKTLTYTVQHQVDGTVRDTQDYTETVWVNDPDTLTVQTGSLAQKTYTGYKYDSMTPETEEGATVADGTVITLIYEKDSFGYTVNHIYVARDGSVVATVPVTGSLLYGEPIPYDTDRTTYDGETYIFDRVEGAGKTITADAAQNVIHVYYDIDTIGGTDPDQPDDVPDKDQLIFTYVSGGNGSITGKTREVITKNDSGSASPTGTSFSPASGYRFQMWTNGQAQDTHSDMSDFKALAYTTDQTFTVHFTQRSDLSYTVNYYWNGTEVKLAPSDTQEGMTYGQEVTGISPITIPGYTPVSTAAQSITIDVTGNVVNFYYYKNVKLTANSDEAVYDGAQHFVSGFAVTAQVEDANAVSGADFSAVTVGASGIDVGTYNAVFVDTVGTVDATARYIVSETANGALVIQPAAMTILAPDYTGYYDGQLHGDAAVPSVTAGTTVYYSQDGGKTWTQKVPFILDAGVVNVSVKTQNSNYLPATASYTLKVLPRPVTLTSGTPAPKLYDTKPLTMKVVEVTSGSFVEGEGFTYNVTGSQTEPGTSANTFYYALNDNTKAANYDITIVEGTLEVLSRTGEDRYAIVINAASGTMQYNGLPFTVSGFDSITGEGITGSARTMTFTLNGSSFAVSGIAAERTETHVNPGEVTGGVIPGYQVEITGTLLITDERGNDVTAQFAPQLNSGLLTITPRPLTLKSLDDSKPYDKTPLTRKEVVVFSGSFATGDSAVYDVTGSQTRIGSSDNFFTYTLTGTAQPQDYEIQQLLGKLTITPPGDYEIVEKTHADGAYGLGDEIPFTITVENIFDAEATVTITEQPGVEFVDDAGNKTGSTLTTTIAPGETLTVHAVYTVQEADLLEGGFTNNVSVEISATVDEIPYKGGDETTDEVEDLEDPNPQLTVVKTTTSTPKDAALGYGVGETITYEITVENTGNLTIHNIEVIDTISGVAAAGDTPLTLEGFDGTLAPGGKARFSFAHTVVEADLGSTVSNAATASGTNVTEEDDDPKNDLPTDVDDTGGKTEDDTEPVRHGLAITKEITNPSDFYRFKTAIAYRIVVTNTGNVTEQNVTVEDLLINAASPGTGFRFNNLGGGTLADGKVVLESLAPGETWVITCQYTTCNDDDGRVIRNKAVVSSDDAGPVTSNTVDAQVETRYELHILYVDEDWKTVAPSYWAKLRVGAHYAITSPQVEGYTANRKVVRSGADGMPAKDVWEYVIYTKNPVEEPTEPTEAPPTDPTDTTPTQPNTEPTYDLTPVVEEEPPVEPAEGEHNCCIMHFLLMLLSMTLLAFYTSDRKKLQKRIFELKRALKNEGVTVGSDHDNKA